MLFVHPSDSFPLEGRSSQLSKKAFLTLTPDKVSPKALLNPEGFNIFYFDMSVSISCHSQLPGLRLCPTGRHGASLALPHPLRLPLVDRAQARGPRGVSAR